MKEFPEADGGRVYPGFVKRNPKNNAVYLERCYEAYPEWEQHLKSIDTLLNRLLPGYNIVQVKAKFNLLRFYWAAPADADAETVAILRECVAHIENLAPELH